MTTFSESHSRREVDAFRITLLDSSFSRPASHRSDAAGRRGDVANPTVRPTVLTAELTDLAKPEVRSERGLRVRIRFTRPTVDDGDERLDERSDPEIVFLRVPQQSFRRAITVTPIENADDFQRTGTDCHGSATQSSARYLRR